MTITIKALQKIKIDKKLLIDNKIKTKILNLSLTVQLVVKKCL